MDPGAGGRGQRPGMGSSALRSLFICALGAGRESAGRESGRESVVAILEDAGADILMEALDALSCECRVEPERPAWSLGWSRVKPDPCSLSVPPEVWAADEQDRLLLLEPEEFLQGVVQLTQVLPVQYPGGMAARASSGDSCLGGSWLARGGGGSSPSQALVLLQLWVNVDVLLVASW
ncbi:probable crossover junction endonuclease EME2 isoform X4 [Tursiops truncatus]|uniref:Probable crossover junction endonuclease EME2 isoform X4 n=1 Tax=Tursiops truncatus TaxID=9739 RepID=A0A6J3Q1J0_TURTR|nr:probable crossover junction endonuclease EME2 isoform X4 [Tursiops truncatus]